MTSSADLRCPLEALMPLIREKLAAGQRVRLSPNGVSMRPLLRPGRDSVVLSPLPKTVKKYDIILYQRENGQFVLHRVVKTGPTFTCAGDGQLAREPGVRREWMLAAVSEIYRDGRRMPQWTLWLYSRVWSLLRPAAGVLARIARKLRR